MAHILFLLDSPDLEEIRGGQGFYRLFSFHRGGAGWLYVVELDMVEVGN